MNSYRMYFKSGLVKEVTTDIHLIREIVNLLKLSNENGAKRNYQIINAKILLNVDELEYIEPITMT